MMIKSRARKVPNQVYDRVNKIGNVFDVPTTKAFIIQEKFLMGDFKVKRKKRNGVYEIDFGI